VKRPVLRFVAPAGPDTDLADLCRRLGPAVEQALGEGRVFVGAERAAAPGRVPAGSVVDVFAAREASDGAVEVLLERDGLLFVSKPPGVATEPDHAGTAASVVGQLAAARGVALNELHALSRLDVGVSGVLTVATTPLARKVVEEARDQGRFRRRYLALAASAPSPPEGRWLGAIGRGARGRWVVGGKDARPAETRYATVAAATTLAVATADNQPVRAAFLALTPATGRTHQLRAHAEQAGVPLLGDPSYGGARRLRLADGRVIGLDRVYLHAAWVELTTPSDTIRVRAPLPEDFLALWRTLGGDDDCEERASDLDAETMG